jgi:hypothetical protein
MHTDDWYDREPKKVIRDIILELLKKWTMRDNATLLYLLNQSCNLVNDIYVSESKLTPALFVAMRTAVQRWKIRATPHCVATAQALSRLDFDAWKSMASFVNQPDLNSLSPEHGKLMDTALFCIGAPHDVVYPDCGEYPKDFFLCGSPHELGARSVFVHPKVHVVNHTSIGAPVHGWMWTTHIGTQITNSRAVVAGLLEG